MLVCHPLWSKALCSNLVKNITHIRMLMKVKWKELRQQAEPFQACAILEAFIKIAGFA
jgi:hypothetical protein